MDEQWWEKARCRGHDTEKFFPAAEEWSAMRTRLTEPPEEIAHLCRNLCKVRVECLTVALKENRVGIWGGTTYSQRQLMLKSRNRLACIICKGTRIVIADNAGICISCGASWRAPVGSSFEDAKLPPMRSTPRARSSLSSFLRKSVDHV